MEQTANLQDILYVKSLHLHSTYVIKFRPS